MEHFLEYKAEPAGLDSHLISFFLENIASILFV